MKRLLLLSIMFFCFALSLSAQDNQSYRWNSERGEWEYTNSSVEQKHPTDRYNEYYRRRRNAALLRWELPKHEVSFQFSPIPNAPEPPPPPCRKFLLKSAKKELKYSEKKNPPNSSPFKERQTSLLMSLSYFYSLTNRFQIGVIPSMRYYEQNWRHTINDRKYDSLSELYFGISPSIRFNIVAKKFFRLYTGVGMSMSWITREFDFEHRTAFSTDMDLTVIGLSGGNKIFGGFEAGYLASGYIKFIVGFRF